MTSAERTITINKFTGKFCKYFFAIFYSLLIYFFGLRFGSIFFREKNITRSVVPQANLKFTYFASSFYYFRNIIANFFSGRLTTWISYFRGTTEFRQFSE